MNLNFLPEILDFRPGGPPEFPRIYLYDFGIPIADGPRSEVNCIDEFEVTRP